MKKECKNKRDVNLLTMVRNITGGIKEDIIHSVIEGILDDMRSKLSYRNNPIKKFKK